MKVWPVPDSYSKDIPRNGEPGSFWEDRGDRFHCGIDIYAPEGSEVLAIQNGRVIDVGVFTNSDDYAYWNKSYFIIIKTPQNVIYKYAELGEVLVHVGDFTSAGQSIGIIGQVLNPEEISHTTPYYIHELIRQNKVAMLHLETYIAPITEVRPYIGGNFFGVSKPYSVLDPSLFLNGSGRYANPKNYSE